VKAGKVPTLRGAAAAARAALAAAGHEPLDAASWRSDGDLLIGGGAYVDLADGKTQRHVLAGLDWPGRKLSLIATNFLPHGIAIHPRHPLMVAAFEKIGPGCAVFDFRSGEVRQFIRPAAGRWFYGHGAYSVDGTLLFSTETIRATREGRVGVRDATTYKALDDFPTYGENPHDCQLVDDGRVLVITNGGGRAGQGDQPCVTWVDVKTRKLLRRQDIQGKRQNAGHFAITRTGALAVVSAPREGLGESELGGVSLRSRGDDDLRLLTEPREVTARMTGEALSVEIHETSGTVAVTHPMGGMMTFWGLADHALRKQLDLERPRGVTLSRDGAQFIVAQGRQTRVLALDAAKLTPLPGSAMDRTFISGSHLFNWTRLSAPLRVAARVAGG
jgi:hypothetical protein